MTAPVDKKTRAKLLEAFAEWNVGYGIQFSRDAALNLRLHLPRISQPRLAEMIHLWISNGHKVKRVPEKREQWAKYHDCYYKIVMSIGETKMFIEIRLLEDSRLDPAKVLIANIHPSQD